MVGAYDVGRPVECWLWSANFSDTYFVLTERGRFALRVHRTGWRTDGEIAYELAAIRHLATKGVSVAAPVAAANGSWLRVVVGGHSWYRRSGGILHERPGAAHQEVPHPILYLQRPLNHQQRLPAQHTPEALVDMRVDDAVEQASLVFQG